MNTGSQRSCPHCGRPLAADELREVCATCLLKAGLDSEAGRARPRFAPPTVGELTGLFAGLEIIEFIGQGGMGAVYKARQTALDRRVALKILPPQMADDPGFSERFTREARALARLNHPNIVAIYDFGKAGPLHYFIMEFVEGLNLREIQVAGRLAPAKALKIIPQVCDALQFAHDEGVVHRDIKPENILIDTKGRVKITDFGIAKILSTSEREGITGAREIIGTPHYMAPEQVEKPLEVDHRADIYSMGVVLYELLTGELPLGRFAPPSRKVEVDVRMDEVVMRTLEKEPARRYQHASQVKSDVETISTTSSTPPMAALGRSVARPASPKAPSHIPAWLKIALAGAVFLLLLSLMGLGLVMWHYRGTTSARTAATDSGTPATPPSRPEQPGNSPAQTASRPASARRPVSTEPEALSATALEDALMDLKSSNWGRRQGAVHTLANARPADRHREVVSALTPALQDSEWSVREGAARALGVWGSTNDTPLLIPCLDDSQMSVRWAAMNSLGTLKDSRAAVPLARRVQDETDSMIAARAIQSLGSPAEDAVLPLLKDQNKQVRGEACQILQEIGTRKSIDALTPLAADSDAIVSMMARTAVLEIRSRLDSVATNSINPAPAH
jgi:serine/threonine protein kinase